LNILLNILELFLFFNNLIVVKMLFYVKIVRMKYPMTPKNNREVAIFIMMLAMIRVRSALIMVIGSIRIRKIIVLP